jgi:hypothetical protein
MKVFVLLAALPMLAGACVEAGQRETRVSEKEIIPARDGNIAIQEELDAARRAGTITAYDLFIARHPQHPLAETARAERAKLPR